MAGWTDVVDRRVAGGFAPGIVALVDRGGRALTHAAGWRDLETRAPMQPDTLFRLASVTKPITAAGAMLLVDDGRLTLDQPLDDWLPELAGMQVLRTPRSALTDTVPASGAVTLRGLLSQTFGLGIDFAHRSAVSERLAALGIVAGNGALEPDDYMKRLGSLPLVAEPGERWLYHIGLDVAAILIGRISGASLPAFMRERLFDPLGMSDTGYCVPDERRHRLAAYYADLGGGRYAAIPDTVPDGSVRVAQGGGSGLFSTAGDLGRFGRMLLDGGVAGGRRILSASSIAELRRDQVSAESKAASPVYPYFWDRYHWGLGLCVARAATPIATHPGRFGWWGGTGTGLFMDPATDLVMVSLTQRAIDDISDAGNADAIMAAAMADAIAS